MLSGSFRISVASYASSGMAWAASEVPSDTLRNSIFFMRCPLASRRRFAGLRMKNDFLGAPCRDFRNVELIGIAAVDFVHRAELLQGFARLAELADDRAVELHLVDLAGLRRRPRVAVIRHRIRDEQVLMRTWRDADCPGIADSVVNRLRIQIVVPHLNARVAAIADVDVALSVHRHRVRQSQLSRTISSRAGGFDE